MLSITSLKAFLTLHYRGFESRFGEEMENFFDNFSVHTHHWRSIPGLAESFGIFLSSLATGHEKCVWSPIMKNSFRYSYLEMGEAFWRRIPKLCPYTSQRTWEVRLGEKIGNFFELFSVPIFHWSRDAHVVRFSGNFSSSLTWEKCQPPLFHYPLEEKRLFERKRMLLSKSFSHWSIWTGKG